MTKPEQIELCNIDPDDLSDVLVKIQKSYSINLEDRDFEKVKTFGELCDLISSQIKLEHIDSCTTQQSFYKIREAIANTQSLEKNSITPDSGLGELFPQKGRRQKILQIQKELGFSLKILKPKQWINNILLIGLFLSIIELFFNWKSGLVGLILVAFSFKIAGWVGKDFSVRTVGDLANKMTRENYLQSRRNPKTMNFQEMEKNIRDLFSHDLDLDSLILTRDASLF